jgi:glycosyltransferase involved in cell wall biosynthesis
MQLEQNKMFVSGFTIIRNAIKYDYPALEAIQSILPICDEVIVLVGNSDDNTLQLIQSIQSDKIKIHHSVWDDSLREGGKALALETNKAMDLINPKADWCFYIQADEVFPEIEIQKLKVSMLNNLENEEVEGLLFQYVHFFGSYNFIASSRDFYRNEIRVIRNNKQIRSYKDAQGFRISGRKLKVKKSGVSIFHYGWVRHPEMMSNKIKNFHQLWHSDEWIASQQKLNIAFDYNGIDSIDTFKGNHPQLMLKRISEKNWDFHPALNKKNIPFRKKILYLIEKLSGYRLGEYKNYQILNE